MRWILLACAAGLAFGSTEPKPKAQDYEVSGVSKNGDIGAEYMVHSFSGNRQMYVVKDFLVVEVALYPPKGETIPISPGAFALRINGKKPVLVAQPPNVVVAAMNRTPWWRKGASAGGGVITGSPPPMPGSPPGGIPRSEPERASDVLEETAIVEGHARGAVSGFLYFPWKGKTSSIKSVELLYEDAILKLR